MFFSNNIFFLFLGFWLKSSLKAGETERLLVDHKDLLEELSKDESV